MNGWKNFETWACSLWLNNDETVYWHWMDAAKAALDTAGGDKDRAADILAGQIKGNLTENAPDMGAGLYAELLGNGLQNIDYVEIARAFLEG